MLTAVRGWVRERPTLIVAVYASVFAVWAFALSRPVLIVNDGHMYFEMARSMRHGSLEIQNGLDLVNSDELWLKNAVKRGPHVYSKYPPLFAVLAALPVAIFSVPGLYLLNSVAFVLSAIAIHGLARRILTPERALLATLLLPLTLPLFPYMLMELPHLVALAPFLWALLFWDDARQADDARRARLYALGSGLLAGLSFGVRLQNVVFLVPLLGLGWLHARRRGALVGGILAGFVVCALAVAAFNARRFGSPNPFSYGPVDSAYGVPSPEENVSIFFRPAFLVMAAVSLGALVAVRTLTSPLRWFALPAAAAIIVSDPSLADVGAHTLGTLGSLILNSGIASTGGWSNPDRTFGWINKALFSCAPFLVLGFAAIFAGSERRDSPLANLLAWTVVVLLLFLSVRDPDPRTQHGAMGFISLTPRYLIEIMPALYILAWDRLRDVSLGPVHLGIAVAAGVALYFYLEKTGNDDVDPVKTVVIATASVTGAALLALAYAGRSYRVIAFALGPILAITNGYAAASIFAEDAHALGYMALIEDIWGQRVLAAMPEPEIALVGWLYAKDAVFHLRAVKPIVTVDPSNDQAASLADTLDALTANGRTAYYFGLELNQAAPHVAGRYRIVPVLEDPLLYRLERINAAEN
jgi:hypothetical protein